MFVVKAVVIFTALFVLVPFSIAFSGGPPTEVTEEQIVNIDKDEIVEGSLLINADSSRMVYLAKDGDKQYMIVDGKRFRKYNWVRSPVFSEDGKKLACIVVDEGYDRPVIDGKAGEKYVNISGQIVLSPDGKRTAFVARFKNAPFFNVVVDGSYEGRAVEAATCELVFSPDGKRLAYNVAGYYSREGDKKHSVAVDGEMGEKYDGYLEGSITFSSDSKKLAYAVQSGDKWIVILDGKEGKKYDAIGSFTGLTFSPDGKKLVYAASLKEKWFAVVNDKEHEMFDDVGKVVFSHDGGRMAYWTREGEEYRLVEDGKKGKKADGISAITFSPDGKRLAYAVNVKGKWFIVVDGKKQNSYDNIAIPIIFSPDGNRMVYAALDGDRWLIVTDGEEGERHQGVMVNTYVFSPEGSNFVYGAIEDNKPFFVVNGCACEPCYEAVMNLKGGKLVFDSEDTFHYLATTGSDYYLVTERIR